MKRWFISITTLIAGVGLGFGIRSLISVDAPIINPLASTPTPVPTPLAQYSFKALTAYPPVPSVIHRLDQMSADEAVVAEKAAFTSGGKTMTLQLMIPQAATPSGGFPVVVMVRGYVDAAQYQTGVGTKNAAHALASAGFVTVAPDFLGYGESDPAPVDTFEARLERPRQLLDLLASVSSLPFVNPAKMGMWGHSNGGQISLSVLEITNRPIPTVLWAPVSKPFPYSILYYTDESPDGGKDLRKALAQFESRYDAVDFSLDQNWPRISAPLQLHQGTADSEVPLAWSNELVKTLRDHDTAVDYYTYPGADHNLRPAWQTVMNRTITFYKEHLYD